MANWKLEGTAVVWDEDAPDPASESVASEKFDPGDHNIDEVKSYVDDHPDEVQAVYDAEKAGKARVSLLDWLTLD